MSGLIRAHAIALAAVALASCASSPSVTKVVGTGSAFTSGAIAQSEEIDASTYRIGRQDKLDITVFQVKELTIEKLQVDGAGRISLPLIGSVVAEGRTTDELATEIADRLRGQYLQSPKVAVAVADAVSQKVTVDGSVIEPGVYKMSGPTSLLQAIAMAKGPDPKYANLSRVAIFRTVDGKRTAAVFDLKAIRAGAAPDPIIVSNDVIVVEGSQMKSFLREMVQALPGFAVFRSY